MLRMTKMYSPRQMSDGSGRFGWLCLVVAVVMVPSMARLMRVAPMRLDCPLAMSMIWMLGACEMMQPSWRAMSSRMMLMAAPPSTNMGRLMVWLLLAARTRLGRNTRLSFMCWGCGASSSASGARTGRGYASMVVNPMNVCRGASFASGWSCRMISWSSVAGRLYSVWVLARSAVCRRLQYARMDGRRS